MIIRGGGWDFSEKNNRSLTSCEKNIWLHMPCEKNIWFLTHPEKNNRFSHLILQGDIKEVMMPLIFFRAFGAPSKYHYFTILYTTLYIHTYTYICSQVLLSLYVTLSDLQILKMNSIVGLCCWSRNILLYM